MLEAYGSSVRRRSGVRLWLAFAALPWLLTAPEARGQEKLTVREIHVAAAADLQTILPYLAQEYEHATGVKVMASYGSSGTLTAQILNGAPFDLFLAADFVYPEKIVAAGLADTKSPTEYAKGALVLWTRKDSPLLPLSVERMTEARTQKVAIADPAHAPYGRAAESALRAMKMYEKVQPKLVVAENVAQAGQFVESGNAQVGLISLAMAMSSHYSEVGTYVRVPTLYPAILQYAVVLAKSPGQADAHAFLSWMLSPVVQGNLAKMGLGAVQ